MIASANQWQPFSNAYLPAEPPKGRDYVPMWQRVQTWVAFLPFIFFIARQAPYLAGPSRDAQSYINGRGAEDAASYHFALYPLLLFQTIVILTAWRSIAKLLQRNPVIIAGLVLVFASALWSRNVGNTLRMGLELADATLFICYFLVSMPTQQFMRFLMFMGFSACVLSIFFVVALPSYGIFAGYAGGAWQGICSHKNTLGGSTAYLLTPVFFIEGLSRLRRVSYALLLLFIIAMSQSRGAWLYTIALLGFVGALSLFERLSKQEAWLTLILGLSLATCALVGMVVFFDVIAPMMGKDATMTGRSDIYRGVWKAIQESPLIGYGYGSFWEFTPQAYRIRVSLNWPGLSYAENGVLELASQLGFLGVGIAFAMFAMSFINAASVLSTYPRDKTTQWYLSIMFLALTTNINAGWLLSTVNLDWPLIVAATIGLAERKRAMKAFTAMQQHSTAYALQRT